MMENKCNSCGSEEYKQLFVIGKYKIVKCSNCNLVFIINPISPGEMKDLYEQESDNIEPDDSYASQHMHGELFRIKEANNRLSKIGNVKTLLDVGCGMGFFIKAAKEKGIMAVGIDVSQNAVEFGKSQSLDIRKGDLLSVDDLKDQSFDVITLWASIEHLYQPKETLEKAYHLLKPGGLIVIETGDIGSFLARITKQRWRIIHPVHFFYFSSKTLDNLLKNVGFKTFRTENDGFIESFAAQFGLRNYIINKFARSSNKSKKRSSSMKEKINKIAGKLHMGDIVIKYARKID